MSSANQDRLGHAVETALFAPLGFGLYVRDMGPAMIHMLVARGRAEVDRRQEQVEMRLHTAKSLGQVLVAFGVPELRRRASAQLDLARERAQDSLASIGAVGQALVPGMGEATRPPPTRAETHVGTRREARERAPAHSNGSDGAASESGDHLPIPGYDSLSASQVVERLAGLGSADLSAVREYESTHRNRRTILGKIDQLAR